MTNLDDATTLPIFTTLKKEFQNKSKKQMRVMSGSLNEIGSPPIKHTLDQCLLTMEQNVQGLMFEFHASLPEEQGLENDFATFNLLISNYLTDLEQDLMNTVLLATKMPGLLTADNPQLLEIRRRIERQIDRCQSIFEPKQVDQPSATNSNNKRGPKYTYDWFEVTHHVWIMIYRGSLVPKTRQEVVEAFQNFFKRRNEKSPSESTIGPYVSPIWDEVNPQRRNDN